MAETTVPPEPEDLALTMLRAIRGEQDRQRETLGEIVIRLGQVEREIGSLKMGVANLHGDFASLSLRLDHLDRRVGRPAPGGI